MRWPRPEDRWEWGLLSLMLAGLALRVWHIGDDSLAADTSWYVTMAESLLRYGEFRTPWAADMAYTHHFPPLFPMFLAIFFLPFGVSYLALQIASLVAAIGFVAAAFLCTWSLYGRKAGFVVGAIAATVPAFVDFDYLGLSETFVAALFTVTIWAILKSLDEPKYIVIAGIFAGLGYLAKASMGPFFLLAGSAGFLWRFLYVRWRVFQDKWYLLAAFLFALLVLPWMIRNLIRHGDWQTQRHATDALWVLFHTPGWPLPVLQAFGWAGFLLLLHALPFAVPIAKRLREWKSERTSGILLAVVLPILIAGFFIAAFSILESFRIVDSPHPARYALTPIIPLLWLGVRDIEWRAGAPAGAPTGGRDLIRTSALFATLGAAIMALSIGIREWWIVGWTAANVAWMVGGSLAGLLVIGLSRRYAWEPVIRSGPGGSLTWRAAPRALRSGLAIGGGLALFVVTWFNIFDWVPLGLATAAALLAWSWRERGFVIPIVLLGASLGGAIGAEPYDQVGEAIAARAAPGDTVATFEGIEPHVWPFLPENVTMVHASQNATWFVVTWRDPIPEGYEVVESYRLDLAFHPGSYLHYYTRLKAEGAPEDRNEAARLLKRIDAT